MPQVRLTPATGLSPQTPTLASHGFLSLAELGLAKPHWYVPGPDLAWTSIGSLSVPRSVASAVLADQQIYVMGGQTGSESLGWSLCDAVESVNIEPPYQCALQPQMQLPEGRCFMTAVRLPSGSIYIMGGSDYSRTCYRMGPSDGVWNKLADMPWVQALAAGVLGPDGKIYLIGGVGTGGAAAPLNLVQCFNPNDGTWRDACTLSKPRYKARAATAGEKIYVFGGVDEYGIINSVEEYDYQKDNGAFWLQNCRRTVGISPPLPPALVGFT